MYNREKRTIRNFPNLNAAKRWDVPHFYASVFRQGINALASVYDDECANGRAMSWQDGIHLSGDKRIPNANHAVWPTRY